jgi:7-carboxy-7-deazaguanine synthase
MIPLNNQPVEKVDHWPDGSVEVHSIFLTIQGEGPYAGQPAVFVRLTGCTLQCPDCDTEYTKKRERMSVQDVFIKILDEKGDDPVSLVVITGGEPFRQNIAPLAWMLLNGRMNVQVETNGTVFLEGFPYQATCVVVSPKGPVNPRLAQAACGCKNPTYKYVVEEGYVDPADGLPTSVLGRGVRPDRPPPNFPGEIILQPADMLDKALNAANGAACVKSCLKFGYRLGAQLHKFFNLE